MIKLSKSGVPKFVVIYIDVIKATLSYSDHLRKINVAKYRYELAKFLTRNQGRIQNF